MTRSDAIATYAADIKATMSECYKSVLECNGQLQYEIYVWEDGSIERLEQVQGDNSWLQVKDWEPRQLFYVTTIAAPCFDPWDYSDHAAPDDAEEREQERAEIIDWMVSDYSDNLSDVISSLIDEAEEQEKYQ